MTQIARDNTTRADTVLGVHDHPERREPLVIAKRAVFKDPADFRAELFLAVHALPNLPSLQERGALARAYRAADLAIRPTERGYEGKRLLGISEVFGGFGQCRIASVASSLQEASHE